MRKDELLIELEWINGRRQELLKEIKRLKASERIINSKIAGIATGFNVGDTVSFDGAKGTWKLSRMRFCKDSSIEFYGFKLKKDGTPSLREKRIYGFGNPMFKVNK